VVLFILVLVIGIAAIAPLIITWRYEKIIERKLPEWVAQASDSLYLVSVEDIDIRIFSKKLTLHGLQLAPDSARLKTLRENGRLPGKIYQVSLPEVHVTGIQWATILTDKELACKSLKALRPKIYVERPPARLAVQKPESNGQPKKALPKFNIRSISITEPDIAYRNFDRMDSLSYYVTGGHVELSNCAYDPKESKDLMKLFYAQGGNMHFDSLVIKRSNSLYAIRTDNISFATTSNSFEIKNFNLNPALSNDDYYKEIGEQDEILTLRFPLVTLQGLNWSKLVNQGELHVKELLVDKPSIKVYISRIPKPAKKKLRRYPGQILDDVQFPLSIKKLTINQGDISYTEKNKSTTLEGTLPFTHLNAVFSNITNIEEEKKMNAFCVANVRGQLLGSIIGMDVIFHLNDSLGAFSAKGFQTFLDGKKLNDITRPLSKLEISSLEMNKMNFTLQCDGKRAAGDFLFLYDDLKLKILAVGEDGTLDSKGLISFIVNKALLYPANPAEGEQPRRVKVSVKRDTHRSFFNLLWTCVRTGALLTAGRNDRIADLINVRKKSD
jgi:hypothetical protein